MKKNENMPEKKSGADFPDIKKIEKGIQTENKKPTEMPDNIPDEQSNPSSPMEIPPGKEDNEVPLQK